MNAAWRPAGTWRWILAGNTAVVLLLWLLAMVVVAPAHNWFIAYPDQRLDLPGLTAIVLVLRPWSVALPLAWSALSLVLAGHFRGLSAEVRNEHLLLHAVVSAVLGLATLALFALAGVLPALRFGASVG